ncbi:MAG: hypothetical protein EOO04_13680 [Chitinophagaceae bacterium]|nr:MAG: hypothetical protein EOO04_13680 [Chitinophagaceae bacterium]
MKKVFTLITAFGLVFTMQAQNDKMVNAMKGIVAGLDSISTAQGWTTAANQFQRIADAEKTQWLPYYYAALSNVMSGLMTGANQPAQTDPLADKAEALLIKAEELQPGNEEIFIVKKMISNLRMQADPMSRWQTYGPQGAEALGKAKAINPANPRVALLEGQDKFYTPEEFGGNKSEAKILFETSIKRFAETKPASEIHPQWGLTQAQYFLAQFK